MLALMGHEQSDVGTVLPYIRINGKGAVKALSTTQRSSAPDKAETSIASITAVQ
jgi:hypothetical protein